MAARRVKFDLGFSRYFASVLIFASHCFADALNRSEVVAHSSALMSYFQILLGFPSLVLLCVLTGVGANLIPIPKQPDKDWMSRYLNEHVGVWLRLTTVFNGLYFPITIFIFSHLLFGEKIPLEVSPEDLLLGTGLFWYLPALMYWSIARIWVNTQSRMKWFSLALLTVMVLFWMIPNEGPVSKAYRVGRIVNGLWFMSAGCLIGPTIFGKIVRATPAKIGTFVVVIFSGLLLHELLLRSIFPDALQILCYIQPRVDSLTATTTFLGSVSVPTWLAVGLQLALMWSLIAGMAVVHFYCTARIGGLLRPAVNHLLGESSFTIYILHFPVLTLLYSKLFQEYSHLWLMLGSIVFAAVMSVPLCLVTLLVRRFVWLRFFIWYKI